MEPYIYQVSGYFYENAEQPFKETGEYWIGNVIFDLEMSPISDSANVHVETLWKY